MTLSSVVSRMADCDVKQKEARADYQGMRSVMISRILFFSDSILECKMVTRPKKTFVPNQILFLCRKLKGLENPRFLSDSIPTTASVPMSTCPRQTS